MKRFVVISCICFCVCTLTAQTTPKIRQLEKQRNELKQQIAESETLLQSTKKDVKSQLGNLALLSGQIEERQKYIQTIENDVKAIQQEIGRLERDLKSLQKELKEKRQKYELSVKYIYRNKSIQDKLMFIFSAEDFGQMYRRLRYVREYADYQRLQGIQVQRKQKQVTEKANSLKNSRKAKEDLLKQGEAEKAKLEAQEQEQDLNTICAERLSASTPEPPEDIPEEPPVEFIPLPGVQGEFPVSQVLADELQRAFPGVNIRAVLAKARAWCVTNPTKRKTAKGVPRFLNGWMERAQNSGRSSPGGGAYVSPAQRRLEANLEAARDFAGVA